MAPWEACSSRPTIALLAPTPSSNRNQDVEETAGQKLTSLSDEEIQSLLAWLEEESSRFPPVNRCTKQIDGTSRRTLHLMSGGMRPCKILNSHPINSRTPSLGVPVFYSRFLKENGVWDNLRTRLAKLSPAQRQLWSGDAQPTTRIPPTATIKLSWDRSGRLSQQPFCGFGINCKPNAQPPKFSAWRLHVVRVRCGGRGPGPRGAVRAA